MPSPKTTRACLICGKPFISVRAVFCSPKCRMDRNPVPDRFWAKVDKRGPDECWPWMGSRVPGREYGMFGIGPKNFRSHRVAFELTFGKIADGMDICHHCDNPPCCNPAHLFEGTAADNMADRDAKGRCQEGERHVRAKLTKEACLAIKADPGRPRDVARRFGISVRTVGRLRRDETWKRVLAQP
jgi:hypothetical protein